MIQWPARILVVLAVFTLTSCASLILRESDDPQERATKFATRILLCPITLCISELNISEKKQDEARQERQAQYWRWVRSLPPEEQAREYRLEEARIQAAGQALLGLGMGGGLFRIPPTPTAPAYQPQPTPVLPLAAPARPLPPVSCTSQRVGQTVYTDCY